MPSPQRAAFYTSGRTSNEAAFLYQLMVRRFGTNNLPDCANMCHESSGVGLAGTVGVGKGTVQLEDFYQADLIVLIGQNPGTNHPRMLSTLEKARRGGARLVSINPLAEAALVAFKNPQDFMNPLKAAATLFGSGTPMADLHLPVRINGDVALLQWACRRLLERDKVDRAFIAERTRGFEEFQAALAAEDPGELLEQCGIQPEQAEALVEALASTQKIIFCWAMGLTQHVNAVDNIQALVNLCLLRGALGRPGAGLCPVRGHSNVQGDRTMGITCHPKPAFLDALGQRFQFAPPREPGLDTVESIRAMRAGQLDVLVCLGGNFLSATPDTEACAEGLRRLELSVQISTKLNRSHLVTGREALILPCLGRSEIDLQAGRPQFVSVENSMGIVHSSQGRARPASPQLLSEVAIVCGLAQRLLGVDWSVYQHDYDRIRSEIEATIPGFQDYNARVRQPEGFTLPNPVRQGGFGTRDGKAHFTALKAPDLRLPPQQYWMMTIRTHDQFNTTVYGMEDRYRGISGRRRVILMHPADAEAEGLRSGELVDLISHFQGQQRVARAFMVITYDIPPGCTATYFPEANALVPLDQVARGSNTPASKSVVISLRRSTHPAEVRAE
jgi:molybdopterin-dependent oxidoreductase alpha subunit